MQNLPAAILSPIIEFRSEELLLRVIHAKLFVSPFTARCTDRDDASLVRSEEFGEDASNNFLFITFEKQLIQIMISIIPKAKQNWQWRSDIFTSITPFALEDFFQAQNWREKKNEKRKQGRKIMHRKKIVAVVNFSVRGFVFARGNLNVSSFVE